MILLGRAVFVLISIVAVLQFLFGISYHSNLLQMGLAASLLAIVSLAEIVIDFKHESSALLCRVAALVIYVAMIFINLSHCLEELTDFGNKETLEDHDHKHPSWGNKLFLLTIGEFAIKTIYCLLIPPLAISNRWKTVIVVIGPSLATGCITLYHELKLDIFNHWVVEHLEPLVAVILTVISYLIVIPSIVYLKPYLLADSPPQTQFDISDIVNRVRKTVANFDSISHVHASREWPSGFKVTMKAHINISKSDPRWVTEASDSFDTCKKQLHNLIRNAGANDVVIEPIFVDPEEDADERNKTICIDKSCHSKDVGCCTVRKVSKDDVLA